MSKRELQSLLGDSSFEPLPKRRRTTTTLLSSAKNFNIDDPISVLSTISTIEREVKKCAEEDKEVKKDPIWVSATQLYNYSLQDPVVDWLKMYPYKLAGSSAAPFMTASPTFMPAQQISFTNFILQQGKDFERYVIKFLGKKVPIKTIDAYYSQESVKKTIAEMKKGTPVIYSAPIKDDKSKTYGVIDLLVRSDWVHKLVKHSPLSNREKTKGCALSDNYHYVVIDIKFSTLPLRADGIHILNQDSYPAYKCQLYIYNQAVGNIQGYTPPAAYIMGRRWTSTSCGLTSKSFDCDDRLGVIDYSDIDSDVEAKTAKGIKWVRELTENGDEWNILPVPSRNELYPNMCRTSGYEKQKEKIADAIGEITSMWYCGVKERERAFEAGVKSWRDKKFKSSLIGFKNDRGATLDAILNINRQTKDLIRPKRISKNVHILEPDRKEYFVDFETVSDIFTDFSKLPESPRMGMIFLIGVHWKVGEDEQDEKEGEDEQARDAFTLDPLPEERKQWRYKYFLAQSLTVTEEKRIMDEFIDLVGSDSILYHWSFAEKTEWNRAVVRVGASVADEARTGVVKKYNDININWCDLCEVFKSEPIVLKGCYKFSLKNVASIMKKHGLIKLGWNSETQNGLDAMVRSWNSYKKCQHEDSIADDPIIQDVIKYNRTDCEILGEILEYLRKNHGGSDDETEIDEEVEENEEENEVEIVDLCESD